MGGEVSALPDSISDILQNMCADSSNTVCIISGRERDKMKQQFGHIKNIYIAAENGFYYGWNKGDHDLEFYRLMNITDWGWKAAVYDIIKSYQERTDGSVIVSKDTNIRWFFRDVDTDFAMKEANELVAHLDTMLENLPIEIAQEKDYVEVRPAGLDKGTFTRKLLRRVEQLKGRIDFILCIGDNQTDECMFKAVKEYAAASGIEDVEFCITVGQKLSHADYYLNDYNEVVSTLPEIILASIEVRERVMV
eukprot:TRINITY_DN4321_c0_g1_i14.p1 TRINITY_DN4321_c0_g1~~TRINITY_DN4321_c0_g1_i14.p1  ORF type:complete len:250 (-),score=67.40 TRINITY_DN4321_c0_g1_i14:189-938(-)